jgi:hypothetical protein
LEDLYAKPNPARLLIKNLRHFGKASKPLTRPATIARKSKNIYFLQTSAQQQILVSFNSITTSKKKIWRAEELFQSLKAQAPRQIQSSYPIDRLCRLPKYRASYDSLWQPCYVYLYQLFFTRFLQNLLMVILHP